MARQGEAWQGKARCGNGRDSAIDIGRETLYGEPVQPGRFKEVRFMYINRIAPAGITNAASSSWLDRIAVPAGACLF